MNKHTKHAWHKLDNAAKIFPPTSGRADTRVFRFSCEFSEAVNGVLLQAALDRAIDDYPSFRYVLKRGLFWYYLEQSDLRPVAQPESTPPCSTIYLSRKSLLFDVTWYGNRINLEAYHALTDGTGALQFLQLLVLHYLKLAYPALESQLAGYNYAALDAGKMTDSYDKYYDQSKKYKKLRRNAAFKLKGPKEAEWRMNIIEGSMPTQALLDAARAHGTTITVFLTALLIRAIHEEMSVDDCKKPVSISIPVNLRNFFKSSSPRNFFSMVDISYDFSKQADNPEAIIQAAKQCLDERLTEDYLQARLNKLLSFERNPFIRPVPLAIKNVCMNLAYYLSTLETTATISNLNAIRLPDAVRPYVKLFDVFFSTDKLHVCVCSYGGNTNISTTSPFVSKDIQGNFFRMLSQMNIPAVITANDLNRN